jgi:hypothetical protein
LSHTMKRSPAIARLMVAASIVVASAMRFITTFPSLPVSHANAGATALYGSVADANPVIGCCRAPRQPAVLPENRSATIDLCEIHFASAMTEKRGKSCQFRPVTPRMAGEWKGHRKKLRYVHYPFRQLPSDPIRPDED